ncbi:GNAT family N-acetyltransferase [Klugiella xanthotipulae]|uniref:Acetyltransferase (GNAT) family protein n=1 Tax=Klugiella xanthotipulae TaxID=244735 RepID=A0A543HYP6_9MICO|nr:GNAT family N-acetyltransferase [Klugiella xanthotipulae]TQM63467.1 acetyltransferase (GNAT) family protein [Klugiella xanthotipulae]
MVHTELSSRVILRLGLTDVGELLTLQRAGFITEAQAHNDLSLPPLTQSLDELRAEIARADVLALGIREQGRLIGSVRVECAGAVATLGRLVVAPDRQGAGLGTTLMRAVEEQLPEGTTEIRLYTGDRSVANIRLYTRLGYREWQRVDAGEYQMVHLRKAVTGAADSAAASG